MYFLFFSCCAMCSCPVTRVVQWFWCSYPYARYCAPAVSNLNASLLQASCPMPLHCVRSVIIMHGYIISRPCNLPVSAACMMPARCILMLGVPGLSVPILMLGVPWAGCSKLLHCMTSLTTVHMSPESSPCHKLKRRLHSLCATRSLHVLALTYSLACLPACMPGAQAPNCCAMPAGKC